MKSRFMKKFLGVFLSLAIVAAFVPSFAKACELADIQVTKHITGSPASIPTGGFSFVLKNSAGTQVGTATSTSTATTHTVSFSLPNYTLPTGQNTNTLTMTEVTPSPIPTGWTYGSGTSYQVVVSSNGNIVYKNSIANGGAVITGPPVFTNAYVAPTLGAIQVTKHITGSPASIPTGGFSFVLKNSAGTQVGTATSTVNGATNTVSFSLPGYTLPTSGTNTLTMTEVAPSPIPTGWTYGSSTSYQVVVSPDGSIVYKNSTANGDAVIEGPPVFTNAYSTVIVPELITPKISDPGTTVPDKKTPLANAITVPNNNTPLGSNPDTGDKGTSIPLYAALASLIALAGASIGGIIRKKRKSA